MLFLCDVVQYDMGAGVFARAPAIVYHMPSGWSVVNDGQEHLPELEWLIVKIKTGVEIPESVFLDDRIQEIPS